ncbi:hypothetical protein DY000_02032400 [Brassica cretica]|uniref:Uncharacterized protein n=1 Tax=Brassica cretica TaxID=69181 RepID=A0ABQ7DH39_BRACR|nr:hypothetical protein DY000_02032400 [Brassica cretica]
MHMIDPWSVFYKGSSDGATLGNLRKKKLMLPLNGAMAEYLREIQVKSQVVWETPKCSWNTRHLNSREVS